MLKHFFPIPHPPPPLKSFQINMLNIIRVQNLPKHPKPAIGSIGTNRPARDWIFFLSEFHLCFLDSVQTCMMNSLYDFLWTHAAFRSSFVTHWSSLFCTQSVFAVLFFSAADCSVCSSQLPTLPLFYPEIDSTLYFKNKRTTKPWSSNTIWHTKTLELLWHFLFDSLCFTFSKINSFQLRCFQTWWQYPSSWKPQVQLEKN